MDGQGGLHGSFGEEHFGATVLGDSRRTKRLVRIADKMVKHPDGTLPDKISDPAELRALYRLANDAHVTHEAVLAPSRARTLRKMAETEKTVLVIHDTTELDFSGLSIPTLGQIGNGFGRGYLVHNTLAVVAETRDVLGLAYQKLAKRPKRDRRRRRRPVPRRERGPTANRVCGRKRVGRFPPRRRGVAGWRSAIAAPTFWSTSISPRRTENRMSCGRSTIAVFRWKTAKKRSCTTALASFAAQATKTLDVPAAKQRPARKAKVAIAWEKMTILVPRQPRGEIRGVPLVVWVVRVWELDPPAGVDPLEWILLTNVAVNDLADAWERVAWYECRWIIEEYHKAMKTGCDIEDNAIHHRGRLAADDRVAVGGGLVPVELAQRQPSCRTPASARQARSFPCCSSWYWRCIVINNRVKT